MRVTVMREPLIVDVNGRSCRSFTGVDEDGNHVRVTIGPGDSYATLSIDVETMKLKPETTPEEVEEKP